MTAYYLRSGDLSSDVCFSDLAGRSYTTLADGAPEYRIAALVVKLVAQLEANKGSDGRLLPPGIGLNVNIPVLSGAQGTAPTIQFARLGLATDHRPVFFSRLADTTHAVSSGHPHRHLHGNRRPAR